MPYARNEDLPAAVKDHLPAHAQDIFRAAFNSGFDDRKNDPRQEEAAFRIAWSAVKKKYHKVGEAWVARED
jgi:cation transport regulator